MLCPYTSCIPLLQLSAMSKEEQAVQTMWTLPVKLRSFSFHYFCHNLGFFITFILILQEYLCVFGIIFAASWSSKTYTSVEQNVKQQSVDTHTILYQYEYKSVFLILQNQTLFMCKVWVVVVWMELESGNLTFLVK
jgi:hypothetical protein